MTTDIWLVPLATAVGVVAGLGLHGPAERAAAGATVKEASSEHRESGRIGSLQRAAFAVVLGALEGWAAFNLGLSWSLPPVAVFLAGLAMLAWCDGRFYRLPKRIQHPTAISSAVLLFAAAAATGAWHRLAIAAACGAVCFAAFFTVNFLSPRAMAFGDVRLAGTIGLVVGWFGVSRTVMAFLVASVGGAAVALVLLATRRVSLDSHLPYGVFLAAGAVVALLA